MNTSIKPSTASIAKGQGEQNRLRPAAQRSLLLVGRRFDSALFCRRWHPALGRWFVCRHRQTNPLATVAPT